MSIERNQNTSGLDITFRLDALRRDVFWVQDIFGVDATPMNRAHPESVPILQGRSLLVMQSALSIHRDY